MCGSAGGCTGCGHERRPGPGGAVGTRGGSIPVRPPARPVDPTSAPHPFPSDARPRPRTGAERSAVPGAALAPQRAAAARAAAPRGGGQLRLTASRREPAAAGPRPSPPSRPARPAPEHTRLHIAALVLEALDAVVLQAGVLGHGCARLRRRLLLRRRRRVEREGTEGEERALRDAWSARWPRRGGGAEERRAPEKARALACRLSR